MRLTLLVPWAILLAVSCRTGEMPVEVEHTPCPEGARLPSCSDKQVARPPEGWQGPVLAWSGAPGEEPECPQQAPLMVYEGYAGLSQEVQCPACSCGPSACRFSDAYAVDQPSCTEGNLTLYPVPEGWDGSCWSGGIIPVPKAIATGFFATTEAPCEPQFDTTEFSVDLSWATLVRACQIPDQAPTCDEMAGCGAMPSDAPPEFAMCIFQHGEALECPRDYPERDVFHRTIDRSAIGCSPCSCGQPEDGICIAYAATWKDTACTMLLGGSQINTEFTSCNFYITGDGDPFGSISGYWYETEPGTCAPSGGEPFGEAVPEEPVTFCCRPR